MKIGKVVYVTEAAAVPAEVEIENELERLGLDARWHVAAASAQGWPAPLEAMLELARRGAHRVELTAARWQPGEGLALAEPAGPHRSL